MNLADYPIVVVCWHQEECGHCQEFIPRLRRFAAAYPCVPVILVDAAQNGRLADGYRIAATPTVTVLRHGRTADRQDRALADDELAALFDALGAQCVIPGRLPRPPAAPTAE